MKKSKLENILLISVIIILCFEVITDYYFNNLYLTLITGSLGILSIIVYGCVDLFYIDKPDNFFTALKRFEIQDQILKKAEEDLIPFIEKVIVEEDSEYLFDLAEKLHNSRYARKIYEAAIRKRELENG